MSGPDGVADGTVDYPLTCEHCGEDDIVRCPVAFDLTGENLCEECGEAVIEDHGQFGVGA